MFKLKLFNRKPAPLPIPAVFLCTKDKVMVPYCQYRAGDRCSFKARHDMCVRIWDRGLGR
jgi:hypothetical protein